MATEAIESPLYNQIKTAISQATGNDRLRNVGPTDDLLSTGLLGSLDLVTIAVELEAQFGIKIPDSEVGARAFKSLETIGVMIVRLQGGESGPGASPRPHGWLLSSAIYAVKRPFLLILSFVVTCVILDVAMLAVMTGPLQQKYRTFSEFGARLYPVGGSYSTDDLNFAVQQHEILRPQGDVQVRVAVFGDSGTIGSYVPAAAAIPAQIEARLKASGLRARVFNLAFFMQHLPKDLMIMEAVLNQTDGRIPFDVAVFTLGEAYFDSGFVTGLMGAMPYLSLNWPLLEQYGHRVAPDDPSIAKIVGELKHYEAKNYSLPEQWLSLHSALFHYAPYFRYAVNEVLRSASPFDYPYGVGRTPALNPVPPEPPAALRGFLSSFKSEAEVDDRILNALETTIQFLRRNGVTAVLYLKPTAPNEWKSFYPAGLSVKDIADRICAGGECRVVDTRWLLGGSQFTDSLAHYNAPANHEIGTRIADEILKGIR